MFSFKRTHLDRQAWSERLNAIAAGTAFLIVNTDIDGLLSALIASTVGWPTEIIGFYDNSALFIDPAHIATLREEPEKVLWLDCSMCWPELRSISQHVTAIEPTDYAVLAKHVMSATPSEAFKASALNNYHQKYPFGLAPFLAWSLLPAWATPLPSGAEANQRRRLLWMPDGAGQSLGNRNRPGIANNCAEWAWSLLPRNPMLAGLDWERPEDHDSAIAWAGVVGAGVRRSFLELRAEAAEILRPAFDGRRLQIVLSENGAARVPLTSEDIHWALDGLMTSLAERLGSNRVGLPKLMTRLDGQRDLIEIPDHPGDRWLAEALAAQRWISFAVVRSGRSGGDDGNGPVARTLAGHGTSPLRAALPAWPQG